jgi:uncharacterized protein YqhQ
MNEIQAHQFIKRWRNRIYPWRSKTEAQAAAGMLRFSLGIMMGMFCSMLAEVNSQRRQPDLFEGLVMGFFILSVFFLFFWLASKMFTACRVLGYSLLQKS